jgi:hypothetical protein
MEVTIQEGDGGVWTPSIFLQDQFCNSIKTEEKLRGVTSN